MLVKPHELVDANTLQWAEVVGIIGGYWSIFRLVALPLRVDVFSALSIFDGIVPLGY